MENKGEMGKNKGETWKLQSESAKRGINGKN